MGGGGVVKLILVLAIRYQPGLIWYYDDDKLGWLFSRVLDRLRDKLG